MFYSSLYTMIARATKVYMNTHNKPAPVLMRSSTIPALSTKTTLSNTVEPAVSSPDNNNYKLIFMINDTSAGKKSEDGSETPASPGHASVVIVKEENGISTYNNISLHPGYFGVFLTAVLFGSISVPGTIDHPIESDLMDADSILERSIDKKGYERALQCYNDIKVKFDKGEMEYAIVVDVNPFALIFATLKSYCSAAYKSAELHKERTGSYPSEDHSGIEVFHNEDHISQKKIKLANCTTTALELVSKTLEIQEDHQDNLTKFVMPSSASQALSKHGFIERNIEEVKKEFGCMINEAESSATSTNTI